MSPDYARIQTHDGFVTVKDETHEHYAGEFEGGGRGGGHSKTAEGAENAARELSGKYAGIYTSKTPGMMNAVNATRKAQAMSSHVAHYGETRQENGQRPPDIRNHSEAAKLHEKAAKLNEKVGMQNIANGHREIAAVHRGLAK